MRIVHGLSAVLALRNSINVDRSVQLPNAVSVSEHKMHPTLAKFAAAKGKFDIKSRYALRGPATSKADTVPECLKRHTIATTSLVGLCKEHEDRIWYEMRSLGS